MSATTEPTMMRVSDVIQVMKRKHKIKTGEYGEEGRIPIVDQSIHFIAGYIDDEERAYDGALPVIVFGDHTCIFKYVNFRFAVGADGTQLIRAKDEELFDTRYLYYALRNVPLKQFGYQRHFKYLKEADIPHRDIEIQVKIAEILAAYDDLIENNLRRNEKLSRARDLLLPRLLSVDLDLARLESLHDAQPNKLRGEIALK